MDNNEKESISKIFTAVWDVTKRYGFIPMDDFLWERFVEEITTKSKELRTEDKLHEKLYIGMVLAVQEYMEKKNKNGKR